jgi:hypothetical protein
MKYGLSNVVESADITTSNTTDAVSTTDALSDVRTTRSYVASQDGASAVEINADLGSASSETIDVVVLAGLVGITVDVTIKLYLASVEQASETVTPAAIVEQVYAVASFDSVSADEIEVSFDVGDGEQFAVGYLFAGELSDALVPADNAINVRIESNDPLAISRASVPVTSDAFRYLTVDFAIVEDAATDLRSLLRTLFTDGYGVPRVWYFDDECIFSGEAILAILDSDALQLDLAYAKDETKARTQIGLVEVR